MEQFETKSETVTLQTSTAEADYAIVKDKRNQVTRNLFLNQFNFSRQGMGEQFGEATNAENNSLYRVQVSPEGKDLHRLMYQARRHKQRRSRPRTQIQNVTIW